MSVVGRSLQGRHCGRSRHVGSAPKAEVNSELGGFARGAFRIQRIWVDRPNGCCRTSRAASRRTTVACRWHRPGRAFRSTMEQPAGDWRSPHDSLQSVCRVDHGVIPL